MDLLTNWTAKSGLKPAGAVDRFLDAASRVTDILSLEEERARAQKEKTAAEVEAPKAIAQSKLTTDAITGTKWLINQGISRGTVLSWQAIAFQLGPSTEGLAQGVAV